MRLVGRVEDAGREVLRKALAARGDEGDEVGHRPPVVSRPSADGG
jgi:hypothetical protein